MIDEKELARLEEIIQNPKLTICQYVYDEVPKLIAEIRRLKELEENMAASQQAAKDPIPMPKDGDMTWLCNKEKE